MLNIIKHHDCKKELKEFNLKATPSRIAVLQFLETTKEPVDVNSIIAFLKKEQVSSDPATVFRMMNDFVNKGVTKQVQLEKGKSRYELAAKGDHHHLICENCGKIESVSDTVIPQMEKEILNKQKFLVKKHSLEFFGICNNCQK